MTLPPDGFTDFSNAEPCEEEKQELAEAYDAAREEFYEAFVAIRRQDAYSGESRQ